MVRTKCSDKLTGLTTKRLRSDDPQLNALLPQSLKLFWHILGLRTVLFEEIGRLWIILEILENPVNHRRKIEIFVVVLVEGSRRTSFGDSGRSCSVSLLASGRETVDEIVGASRLVIPILLECLVLGFEWFWEYASLLGSHHGLRPNWLAIFALVRGWSGDFLRKGLLVQIC